MNNSIRFYYFLDRSFLSSKTFVDYVLEAITHLDVILEEFLEVLVVVDVDYFVPEENYEVISRYYNIESVWIIVRGCYMVGYSL